MSQKFQRKIEDFICAQCGGKVVGDGFTNHCPKCLWSRHVDIYPGDRANSCGGLMKPVRLELNKGAYEIVHQCQKCHVLKNNKADSHDDIDGFLTNMV